MRDVKAQHRHIIRTFLLQEDFEAYIYYEIMSLFMTLIIPSWPNRGNKHQNDYVLHQYFCITIFQAVRKNFYFNKGRMQKKKLVGGWGKQ